MGTTNNISGFTNNSVTSGAVPPPIALQLSDTSANGALNSSNLGSQGALGLASGTSSGNVANTPSTAYDYQVVSAQNTAAQQQVQPAGANIQGILQQGVSYAANQSGLLSGVTNSINSFGNSALGLSAGTGTAASGASGASAELLSGSSGEFGSGLSTSVSGELGSGLTGEGASGIEAAAPAWTGTTFSGALGEAGIGAGIGGLTASLLGENQLGGTVGGAIGGVAGGFAGGAALGAALGSWAPGVGTVLGALAGGVIGGLFGNNKPTDATQVGGVSLASGQVNPVYQNQESDTGSKYSASNASVAQNAQSGASNLAQWLIANGATPTQNTVTNGVNLVVKTGSRDGTQVGFQNEAGPNATALNYVTNLPVGASASSVQTAINNAVLTQYNVPAALQTQLQNINPGAFYATNFDPSQLGNNAATTAATSTAKTPTIAPVNSSGRGILQIPNNSTGS